MILKEVREDFKHCAPHDRLPTASGVGLRAAVASSEATAQRLRDVGVEVVDANSAGSLSLYVDGADEATRRGELIKGGGGRTSQICCMFSNT